MGKSDQSGVIGVESVSYVIHLTQMTIRGLSVDSPFSMDCVLI